MKTFYIFVGVQGSGKTSLFNKINDTHDVGQRICLDDVIKKNNHSIYDKKSLLADTSAIYNQLKESVTGKETFNFETSIISTALVKFIKIAKENNFKIHTCFVYLDTFESHINRINLRVQNGGHPVDKSIVLANYKKRFDGVDILNQLCDDNDVIDFYDNSTTLAKVAEYSNNQFKKLTDTTLPFENQFDSEMTK